MATYVKRLALQNAPSTRHALPQALSEQLADLDRVIRSIANNVRPVAPLCFGMGLTGALRSALLIGEALPLPFRLALRTTFRPAFRNLPA